MFFHPSYRRVVGFRKNNHVFKLVLNKNLCKSLSINLQCIFFTENSNVLGEKHLV